MKDVMDAEDDDDAVQKKEDVEDEKEQRDEARAGVPESPEKVRKETRDATGNCYVTHDAAQKRSIVIPTNIEY